MKVRIILTVDVDPETWAADNGVTAGEVRRDVRTYVETLVRESHGGGYFQTVEVAG